MTEPFDSLLTLASLDAEVITLERSRAHLPGRVALGELEDSVAQIDRALGLVRAERQPLDATLGELDEAATRLAHREQEIAAKLEAATGAGRELEAMDVEVHRLAKTRSELEDQEIELLEALEPMEERERSLSVERDQQLLVRSGLVSQLEAEDVALDRELVERRQQREDVATRIEPSLLARYDKLASRSDGVGAATIEHGHCSGCHLSLASVELDKLKKMPIEEIAICEQCSRILLRPEQLG
jgi:predicted  nucleic acid-binding Zn-ribbon protein